MSKAIKSLISIMLAIALLCCSNVYALSPSKIIAGKSSAPTILITISGTVAYGADNTSFVLTSEKSVVYNLTGNTAGLEKYLGVKLYFKGYIVPSDPRIMSADSPVLLNDTFYVLKYAPATIPTPTPIQIKLAGVLSVSDKVAAPYLLTTEQNVSYYLTGKTDGMDQYVNSRIVVSGYIQVDATTNATGTVATAIKTIVVTEYAPVTLPPTQPPTNIKLTGSLVTSDQTAAKYALVTESDMRYLLTGKTDGMDQYIGKKIVVTGYIQSPVATTNSSVILPQVCRIFVVVEYTVITVPTPPVPPVQVKLTGTLSVSTDKVYYLTSLTSEAVKVILIGKTDGLDQCIGKKIVVVGNFQEITALAGSVSTTPIYRTFVVTEYTVLTDPVPPIPVNITMTGKLSLTDNTIYKYALTTETNARYFLTGKIDGMDQNIGKKIVVTGYYQQCATATNSTATTIAASNVFVVVSYSVVPDPIPNPPVNIKITGKVLLTDNTTYKYALTTDSYVRCFLTGKIDGMDQTVGKSIVATGYFQQSVTGTDATTVTTIANRIFVVVEYTVVPDPTPIPNPPVNFTIAGTLAASDSTTAPQFILKTEAKGNFFLTGKTDGMAQYVGKKIAVTGYIQQIYTVDANATLLPTSDKTFVVVEYSVLPDLPAPTPPINTKLCGTLSVLDQTAGTYALTSYNNSKCLLTGKTEGMDQYVGRQIVVSGYFQKATIQADGTVITPSICPVFVVIEYSVLQPANLKLR